MPRADADQKTAAHYAARKAQIEKGEPSFWDTLKSHLPEYHSRPGVGQIGGASGQAKSIQKGVLK